MKTILISDDKVLSRRQTGLHTVQEDCSTLNEIYSIPLQKNQLDSILLMIIVYRRYIEGLESGKNKEVGRTSVGCINFASGHRLTHWNDVTLYRGITITRTHSLY